MSDWAEAFHEPPLADILADPIIQALMMRDRVEHRDIEQLFARARRTDREKPRVAA